MTTQSEPEPTSSNQMTCLRMLYVLRDEAGNTWLAAEGPATEALGARGGSMSHRPDGPEGGSMSHLGPGDTFEVEGDDADQVTVLVRSESGEPPRRMQAYRVSPALLPTGDESAAS